jgi:hypothetical protein
MTSISIDDPAQLTPQAFAARRMDAVHQALQGFSSKGEDEQTQADKAQKALEAFRKALTDPQLDGFRHDISKYDMTRELHDTKRLLSAYGKLAEGTPLSKNESTFISNNYGVDRKFIKHLPDAAASIDSTLPLHSDLTAAQEALTSALRQLHSALNGFGREDLENYNSILTENSSSLPGFTGAFSGSRQISARVAAEESNKMERK